MDILRTWIDSETGKEKAKLYRNIDPESISIIGLTIYFAHEGIHKKGSATTAGHYKVPISCAPYFITDPEMIKQEMSRFTFSGDMGVCNQVMDCDIDV